MSLGGLRQKLINRGSDSICLLYDDRKVTVRQLLQMADSFRQNIAVPAGCRIALTGLTPFDLIVALVALDGHAGAMLLLPPSLSTSQVSELVVRAQCCYALNENGSVTRLLNGRIDGNSTGIQTSWLLATSGTTGMPKLIDHSFNTLTRTVKSTHKPGFVWGLVYDPSRFAGLQVVLQSLLSGSPLALSVESSFESQVMSLVKHEVTALSATPSLWRKLLMDGRVTDLKLKQVTLGGETADQSILCALQKKFPDARIVHIYASTEAGVGFAVQDGQAGFPACWLTEPPVYIPSLRISENSHLLIKPSAVSQGAEVTSRIDADGYFDTEDLVRLENDRVYFLGRASGAINVGGNKVNPEEVETFLRKVDGVHDARVVGKKSSVLGQLVVAEIVPDSDACHESLKQFIRKQSKKSLEAWQVPAMIKIVSALEEGPAGKRLRFNK